MADKIAKFLAKLSDKQLDVMTTAIDKIVTNNIPGLDVKPLKGSKGFYRVRVGDSRIIFERMSDHNEIVHIAKRDDRTYRDF